MWDGCFGNVSGFSVVENGYPENWVTAVIVIDNGTSYRLATEPCDG
jgi:hypothetical protein